VIAGHLGTKPVITAQLNASFNGPGLSSSVAFSVVTPSPAPYGYDTSLDDDDEAPYGYEVPDESDSEDEYHPGSDSCTSVDDGYVSMCFGPFDLSANDNEITLGTPIPDDKEYS
jgi:hypothetical protein